MNFRNRHKEIVHIVNIAAVTGGIFWAVLGFIILFI